MTHDQPPGQELEELTAVARRLVDQDRYEEAIQLFEVALRLDPENRGIQLSLAEVRRRQREASGPQRTVRQVVLEKLRRDALDAKHFLGLAHLWTEKGDEARAMAYLEVALARDLPNPSPHKLMGKLLSRRQDFEGASKQLRKAFRYNPFDRQIAESLGRAEYECQRFEAALEAFVDAFLLLSEEDREGSRRIQRKVQTLKEILRLDNDELIALFHERREVLHTAFDRLEWHLERFERERAGEQPGSLDGDARETGRIALAARLRALEVWSHLTDEQIFELTDVIREEWRDPGQLVFSLGSRGRDFYVLEEGEITVQRDTHYGTFPLGILKPGDIFGEVNFLSNLERSADAVAASACRLLRFDARELDRLVGHSPELGVQLYWAFWHGLAFKLRCTNEQLRTFFQEEGPSAELKERLRSQGEAAAVDLELKRAVFQEQGLSGPELVALTTFSQERSYDGGAYLFREGDPGQEMYVVVSGRVRISKHIPGGGEEALAILGRGGFFGEMSLIDGQPRSADARAHETTATVLALDQETIREVFSTDPDSALQFLSLLCRLIAQRLREIDEKVISWRIMSGQFEEG